MFRVIIGAPASSASAAMTRAALVLAVRPMTRPPVSAVQIRANAAMTCVLPVPAGATRAVDEPGGGQQARAGLPLGVIQVRAGQRGGRGLRRDPLRDRQPGHVHQVLLEVKMLAGDEPLLAGRPVDRRAVLAQAEPGHVDDVGHRGDLVDVHALGPPGQRLVGEPVEVRLRVDVGRQRGKRVAELEQELAARPRRVRRLHRGDGLADDAPPLRPARQPARRVLRRVRRGRFVERGQLPGAAPLRLAGPRLHPLPGRRRVVVLGVPRLQSGLLPDPVPGRFARSVTVLPLVGVRELACPVPQLPSPG